jgi:hypothetical protein
MFDSLVNISDKKTVTGVAKMKDEKMYGAMVRLGEATYFELRKIALDRRSTFNRFAREILENYLVAQRQQETKIQRHQKPTQ